MSAGTLIVEHLRAHATAHVADLVARCGRRVERELAHGVRLEADRSHGRVTAIGRCTSRQRRTAAGAARVHAAAATNCATSSTGERAARSTRQCASGPTSECAARPSRRGASGSTRGCASGSTRGCATRSARWSPSGSTRGVAAGIPSARSTRGRARGATGCHSSTPAAGCAARTASVDTTRVGAAASADARSATARRSYASAATEAGIPREFEALEVVGARKSKEQPRSQKHAPHASEFVRARPQTPEAGPRLARICARMWDAQCTCEQSSDRPLVVHDAHQPPT